MDKNGWKEISSEINDVTKKIKDKVSEEDIVGDLRDSLNATVESASQVLKNISSTVQNTISDEETNEIVSKINEELKSLINQIGEKINISKSEEE
jgi:fructose-1,6-bisphosphatase